LDAAADSAGTGGASPTDARPADGPVDGAGGACNLTAPFGTPVALASLNSAQNDVNLSLSPDGLVGYIASDRTGAIGGYDIWMATRNSTADAFGAAVSVGGVNGSSNDVDPRISRDGLRLFMRSDRDATNSNDILVATRTTTLANFGTPAAVAGINSTASEEEPFLMPDEKTIYFESSRPGGLGGYDIYTATVGSGGTFGPPQAVGSLNSAAHDTSTVLTSDGLTIYFGSTRNAGKGYDIFVSRRSTLADGFGNPQLVTELSGTADDWPSELSPDGCTLYFVSTRAAGTGAADLYFATRGR
jgi:hypothetical protein